MTLITLFDILSGKLSDPPAGNAWPDERLARFAEKLVALTLAGFDHIRQEEALYISAGVRDSALDLEILVAVWRLYEQWVDDAELVLDRATRLSRQGSMIDGTDRLDRAVGTTRARLTLSPEQIAGAKDQARRGLGVPVKELRDELRARIHS